MTTWNPDTPPPLGALTESEWPRTVVTQPALPMAMHMTLRDYFAAQALASVVGPCAADKREPDETIEEMFARKSFAIADAMMAARGRQA